MSYKSIHNPFSKYKITKKSSVVKKVAFASLLSGLFGAGVALLTTKTTGKQNRQLIAGKTKSAIESTGESLEQFRTRVNSLGRDVSTFANHYGEKISKDIQSYVEDGTNRSRHAIHKAAQVTEEQARKIKQGFDDQQKTQETNSKPKEQVKK